MENSQTKTISFVEALVVFALAIFMIVFLSMQGAPTAMCPLITGILLAGYNVFRLKMKVGDCVELAYQKIYGSMSAIAIIVLSGFNAVTWAMCGTTPYLVINGLNLLTPATCLMLTFILMFASTALTGQAWGMMPTIGMACFTVANALGINPALTIGTIISATYLGDTLSLLSDGTNYQAAMIERDVLSVVKGNLPVTIPGAIIGLVAAGIMGMSSGATGSVAAAREISAAVAATGSYGIVTLLPIVVLFVLIFLKVHLVPCVLGSSLTAILIGVLTGKCGFMEAISNAWNGMSSATGDAVVDALFTVGGASGMAWTVFVIFAACVFASQFVATGAPNILLGKAAMFCSSVRSLGFTTLIASVACLVLTGGQYTSMTLVANVFNEKYKEMNVDPSVLSQIQL